VLLGVYITCRGELGLRGSQLEGLTRELEFTRRSAAATAAPTADSHDAPW
jgi:hypothetical protein